jgi:hypothetical protein
VRSVRSPLGTDLLWLATAAALLVGATGVVAGTDVRSDAQIAVINTRPVAAVTVPTPPGRRPP